MDVGSDDRWRGHVEGQTMVDWDDWRWQLALGLGRTVLFVAVLMALATLVDTLG